MLTKLQELQGKYKELKGQIVGVRDKAKAEDRDLSDEETTQVKGWLTEGDEVKAAIEVEIKAEEDRNALDERINAFSAFGDTPTGRLTPPINPNPSAGGEDHERRSNPDIVGGPDSKRFASFGEMLLAVRRAEIDRVIDPRLRSANDFTPQAAASGASEGLPSAGGFLVEQQTMAGLWEKAYDNAPILGRISTVPIGQPFNGVKINGIDETSRADGSRFGGVRGYWAAEADTVTATKPAFRQVSLDLKKLMALYYATDELLADAVALEAVVSRVIPLEMQFKLENAIINGTGAGQPLGITNSGAVVTVNKETGQAATTITYNNIVNMWARCWAPSMASSVWLVNQDILPQLTTMSLSIGTAGYPVYLPQGGANASPYGMLTGRPVIPVEYCATLGTEGDIILADLSQYQGIEKGGLQQASSMHVRFIYGEMTYRFTFRFDGQPMWNSALTPYSGSSNTLSPFITLQSRT